MEINGLNTFDPEALSQSMPVPTGYGHVAVTLPKTFIGTYWWSLWIVMFAALGLLSGVLVFATYKHFVEEEQKERSIEIETNGGDFVPTSVSTSRSSYDKEDEDDGDEYSDMYGSPQERMSNPLSPP